MTVAPNDSDPRCTSRAPLALVRADRKPLAALPEEPIWWAAVPLGEGGRDPRDLPGDALTMLVGHYLPFVLRVLARYEGVLPGALGEAGDIPGQAAEWLLHAVRRYDPTRGVPFAGYVVSLVPYWVQLAVRSRDGRYIEESERRYARAVARSLATVHRPPTLAELGEAFGENEAATAERLRAVAVRRALRHPEDVSTVEVGSVPAADGIWTGGGGADERALAVAERGRVTAAVLAAACDDPAGVNARGLWSLALEQYGGYTRADLAAAGRCSKKPFLAAQHRLLTATRDLLAAG
jgi:hypothetical protein